MLYKRKKNTYSYLVILSIITILSFSCSPQYIDLKKQKKIEKKQKKDTKRQERQSRISEKNSKSKFKAYYNSYYLAKIKFKNALEELSFKDKTSNLNRSSNKNSQSNINDKDIFDAFYNGIDSESYKILSEGKKENNQNGKSFNLSNYYQRDLSELVILYDFMTKSRNVNVANKSSAIGANSMKLLDDAIKYSDLVLDDFYNTSYLLDAAYIKGRSSYLKNIFSSSNYYFNKIIEDQNSPYYYDSLVRLGFISVRLNDRNRLSEILEELDSNIYNFKLNIKNLNKKNPYRFIQRELYLIESNYFILKAENALLLNKPIDEIEYYYLLAIKNSNNETQIKAIYSILLSLFKSSNNIPKVLEYINNIIAINIMDEDNLSADIYLYDWLRLNRTLGFYDKIYKHIKFLNRIASNTKDEIYLLLERAKTYFSEQKIEEASSILNKLLLDYEDEIKSNKNYFSQAYYYLGEIALKTNDYELALNYFDLSIEKQSNNNPSIYKSKALNSYLQLHDQYLITNISSVESESISDSLTIEDDYSNKEVNNFHIAIPSEYNYESSDTDTLLFNMGSILYFDLNMEDEAFSKFELIYNNYINSPLIPQVIKILQTLDPSTDWRRSFLGDLKSFVNKKEMTNNVLIDGRNRAFDKMNTSLEEAINIFQNNFIQYDDFLSLYMIAFIYDTYLNDPYKSIEFYNKYLEYEEADNVNAVERRLSDIEEMLDDEINIIRQKTSYSNALEYLMYNIPSNKDTLIYNLEECKKGKNVDFVKKCEILLDILDFPKPEELKDTLSNNIIIKWSNDDMDWRIFNIAKNLYRYIGDNKSASEYSRILIDYYEDSDYIHDSHLLLSVTDTSQNWSSILSDNMSKDFLEIEQFNPRTGLDVVNAYMQRPIPLTITSKNFIYETYKDSLEQDNNILSDVYFLKYKKDILSNDKNNGEKFLISKIDSSNNKVYYTLDKHSILKWDTRYSDPEELSQDSYYLDQNIPIIRESISLESKNYRYNINSTKSECFYLNESSFCYEIRAVPNEDDFYKKIWFLEIEDNIFLKIKENISDIDDNLLFKKEISYKKIDSFYIVNNVKIIDVNQDVVKILNVEDIDINKGLFQEDLMIKNNKKSDDNPSTFNHKLADLIAMKDILFPVVLEEVTSDALEDSTSVSDNPFQFVQSINQYFYFIEIATIDGEELNENDLIVAYNNDIVVGARPYIPGGRVDVPVMGYDNSSESTKISTKGYCEIGDIPTIKVHRENGDIVIMDVTLINDNEKLDFQPIGHVYVVLNKD